ncbi:hypothetical protein [Lysobacter niastensis]|uniref:Uncharacterized protein n=1 Tax=Lysobacter niastensis TaxID=380629 RepID=A0ABS0BA20_9GAMM|nr:hypothetical protein [Lysobacter niastensis]MBF6023985.1 hypothetical protein [Lysobacter niastensis]
MSTWPALQSQLQALRDDVPGLLRESPDSADFFGKFASRAGLILERAPSDLTESVRAELGAIVRDLNLADDGED